jgi:hypothetical protein
MIYVNCNPPYHVINIDWFPRQQRLQFVLPKLGFSKGEIAMGFDQPGKVVIKVQQGNNGQWDVNEVGFEKPLASFDSKEKADEYANDIAKTKGGASVQTSGDN